MFYREAKDDGKIKDSNYQAIKIAIERARSGANRRLKMSSPKRTLRFPTVRVKGGYDVQLEKRSTG